MPSICNNSDPSPTSLTGGLAGYVVGPGYDQATGWGSLDVANFVAAASPLPLATTIKITASENPLTISQAPILTATVGPITSMLAPTGTVQFYANGTALGSPVALSAGIAVLDSAPFGVPGIYNITAVFSGDLGFFGPTSPALSLGIESFITPVDTVSTPDTFTFTISPSIPGYSFYDDFLSFTLSGPGARFFSISNNTCVGIVNSGACTITVVFAPPFLPAAGQTLNATLTIYYDACQIVIAGSGVAPPAQSSGAPQPLGAPAGCTAITTQEPLAGSVTGNPPAPVAQIQITPTQPVLVYPGNYGPELAKDASGTVYASISGKIVEFTGGSTTPTVIAGDGGPGGTGDKGPALSAGVSPYGLAVNSSGAVFEADSAQVVRKIAGGTINLFTGAYGQNCVLLEQSYHIGSEFASGCYGGYPYSSVGFPTPGTELVDPTTLATDGINLFINDFASDTIRMVDVSGNVYMMAGYASYPYFFEGYNTVNTYPGYSGDGYPAGTGSPPTATIATNGYSAAQVNSPVGMAIDQSANLYIADQNNSVVRKIDGQDIITTYLGKGPTSSNGFSAGGYSGDGGPASNAQLSLPVALTFDLQGDLYLIDQYGYAFREVQINNGVLGNINTFYSIQHGGLPPPPLASGTPVIDSSGEMLYSSYFNLPTGTYSTPTAAPGIYEVLGSGVLTFPAVEVGAQSSPMTVTITNPGTAALTVSGTAMAGAAASPSTGFGTLNAPDGIAIDASGSVWTANSGDNSVTEFIGLAVPPAGTPIVASYAKTSRQPPMKSPFR